MIKHRISGAIAEAVASAQARGLLPAFTLPEVPVTRPSNPAHGDYASSLPLRLARAARLAPLAIAQRIADEIPTDGFLARVEVAPPGFINVTLAPDWVREQAREIVAAGPDFGRTSLGGGRRVQVEFVSANPTGHLTAASGRAGAFGDTLANVLGAAGYDVQREYYVNNAGSRMEAFYRSVWARYLQELGRPGEVPADGYHGDSIVALAREIVAERGDGLLAVPEEAAIREIGQLGLEKIIEADRHDLSALGVEYDRWFSEQGLFDSGLVARVLEMLRERGYIAEREGAIWFTSSALGDDKDNVLIRSNGIPTYFASDIAYHYDKLVVRGFDQVIDIWGADHQGHVPRMKAAVSALGLDPQRLSILIHQLITLKRGGEVVRMSKRTGRYVTLRDVIDDVKKDACRFFFLARSADAMMEFDLDLAKKESVENPVYYVQYAHARIASILRRAGDEMGSGGVGDGAGADVGLLTHPAELDLVRKMLELPELIEIAALNHEPHHLPFFAQELAGVFHSFYTQCKVIDAEAAELTRARLLLVRAAKIALANTLRLMGVDAPEKMERLAGEGVAETA